MSARTSALACCSHAAHALSPADLVRVRARVSVKARDRDRVSLTLSLTITLTLVGAMRLSASPKGSTTSDGKGGSSCAMFFQTVVARPPSSTCAMVRVRVRVRVRVGVRVRVRVSRLERRAECGSLRPG